MTVEETLRAELKDLISEAFSKVSGHFLDRGTSLGETLAPVDAETASRPSAANGETLAGHLFHTLFYLDVVDDYAEGRHRERIDWSRSWVVKSVTEGEWAALKSRLAAAEVRLQASAAGWDLTDPERCGGVVTMLVHTAFHLGAMRQIADATASRPPRPGRSAGSASGGPGR